MPPPDEQTHLIQVVHVAPPRPRYRNHTLRRFCTIALFSTLIAFAIFVVLSLLIVGDFPDDEPSDWPHLGRRPPHPSPHHDWPESQGLPFKELEKIMIDTPDPETARSWSHYYTAGPHLAGKNESQAVWTKDLWQSFGIDSEVVAYDVWINYPKDHALSLLKKGKVDFKASLEEDVLEEDPTTSLPDRVPTFHGYSASGNVTAQYVYANFGTYKDYQDLVDAGIDLKGKIAVVKYGYIFRGLKVKRAQDLGMVGCIIYTDPQEDGDITELNGYKPYPQGPARNPSSVQRGSVQFLSFAPGDPTTIGYPSKPGVPRGDTSLTAPQIPSIPISYADALPILKALNGHGPNATSLGDRWLGGGLTHKGIHYNVGPSPESLTLNLYNEQDYTITPLWNTIGIINGTHQDEVLIIGNHRDAWIAGGAGDPNSGSAALNEIIRSYSAALAKGWKPQRTIVFASWDGEEYGLLGSTEWVEEYLPWLSKATFAYLNVDVGAEGVQLQASAAPLLNQALVKATKQVQSPNQTVPGSTVYDIWDKQIRTIGSGSDYTAFQDYAGIPSIDLSFQSGFQEPVYHYHSNYDSAAWMDKYGDPKFEYHTTIAKVLGLLSVQLLESPLISFNATDYSDALQGYLDNLPKSLDGWPHSMSAAEISSALSPLRKAISRLQRRSVAFDAKAHFLTKSLSTAPRGQVEHLYRQIRRVNQQYKKLERAFLYDKGLDGRNWFKHVVFAPGLWTGYAGATWPGLVERAQAGDKKGFQRWVDINKRAVERAVKVLDV